MLWILCAGACLLGVEERMDQRVGEMRDHEIDAFDALVALHNGNLKDVRQAGDRLSRRDEVPELPEAAQPMLAAVRGEGKALADASSLGEAANALGRMAGHCGDCHQLLQVKPAGATRNLPIEEAFFAVAFHEEARWNRAQSALAKLGAEEAKDWAARRAVLAQALRELASQAD